MPMMTRFVTLFALPPRERTHRRDKNLPRWLPQLDQKLPLSPERNLPSWQDHLWKKVYNLPNSKLLLHDTLQFPPAPDAVLQIPGTKVRCGIGEQLQIAGATYGVRVFLLDEEHNARNSTLLLSSTAYRRFHDDPIWEHPYEQSCSITDPVIVLETDTLRAEFTPQPSVPLSHEPEMLPPLIIKIAVWRRQHDCSRSGH